MRGKGIIGLIGAAVVAATAGCSIQPELHLRQAVETRVVLATEVNVDLMWQINWDAIWDFNWDVRALGPLGYSQPGSMRLHLYALDAEGKRANHAEHNFVGNMAMIEVTVGNYGLLFHNNDSEALLFRSDDDLSEIYAYTRTISSGLKTSIPVLTLEQKKAGYTTKAGEPEEEPVSLTPDDLFSLYDPARFITDDPDKLIYENGRYILRIEGQLNPSTFIYLIQVRLRNNDGRVIGSGSGAAITGMSEGVNLFTRETEQGTVSVPMDVYMDKEQDLLGAKVYTFGIPGCNPYDKASVEAAPSGRHYLVLNVTYVNGSTRNIRADITDQVRDLPTGGVITLDIDVDDFPPDERAGGTDGFNALIEGWNEETGSTTIIN